MSPNETQSECTGYDLALGSIHGIRTFRVDRLGRLKAVAHEHVWKPGENIAVCRKDENVGWFTFSVTLPSVFGGAAVPEKKPDPKPHTGVDPLCTCGFYAYHDGVSDFGDRNTTLTGIIEGYGKTTVGTRGFRCQKARIVAVVRPSRPRVAKTFVWPPLIGVLLLAVFARLVAIWPHEVPPLAGITGALCFLGGVGLLGFSAVRTWLQRDEVLTRNKVDRQAFAKVLRNYPDVQVFRTTKAALRAFPMAPATEQTPETDPQFWERAS